MARVNSVAGLFGRKWAVFGGFMVLANYVGNDVNAITYLSYNPPDCNSPLKVESPPVPCFTESSSSQLSQSLSKYSNFHLSNFTTE